MQVWKLAPILISATIFAHGNEVHEEKDKSEQRNSRKKLGEVEKQEQRKEDNDTEKKVALELRNEPEEAKQDFEKPKVAISPASLQTISKNYQEKILSIFRKACFDCHTDQTQFPWYYKLPLVKGQIDKDIAESQEHLILSETFPFGGHGEPLDDLKAIEESIRDGHMPPFKYQIMHWDAFLDEEQKQSIFLWVKESLSLIKSDLSK